MVGSATGQSRAGRLSVAGAAEDGRNKLCTHRWSRNTRAACLFRPAGGSLAKPRVSVRTRPGAPTHPGWSVQLSSPQRRGRRAGHAQSRGLSLCVSCRGRQPRARHTGARDRQRFATGPPRTVAVPAPRGWRDKAARLARNKSGGHPKRQASQTTSWGGCAAVVVVDEGRQRRPVTRLVLGGWSRHACLQQAASWGQAGGRNLHLRTPHQGATSVLAASHACKSGRRTADRARAPVVGRVDYEPFSPAYVGWFWAGW